MFSITNKIALAVTASAVVMSGGANAAVDLSADTPNPATYASEIVLGTGESETATLTIAGGVTLDMPITMTRDAIHYLRVDLVNGEFTETPTLTVSGAGVTSFLAGDALLPGAIATLRTSGGKDSNFVIFSISTEDDEIIDTELGATLTIGASGLQIDTDLTADTTATVNLYDTITLATEAARPVGTSASGTLIDYKSGLEFTFTPPPITVVAQVSSNFLRLNANTKPADPVATALGSLNIEAADGVFDTDGTPITLADLTTEASVTIAGDYSFATGEDGTIDNTLVALGSGLFSDPALTASSGTFVLASSVLGTERALWVTPADEEAFLKSTYAATITLKAAAMTSATASVSLAPQTGSFGEITRNGRTVDIPYITTFADYNQRLIVVNRGTGAADYNITFTAEEGVTATGSDSASGTIAGSETTIFRMVDLVTLTGGTRTAGQIIIDAPGANLDVATTQVNLDDASTDTIVLD